MRRSPRVILELVLTLEKGFTLTMTSAHGLGLGPEGYTGSLRFFTRNTEALHAMLRECKELENRHGTNVAFYLILYNRANQPASKALNLHPTKRGFGGFYDTFQNKTYLHFVRAS